MANRPLVMPEIFNGETSWDQWIYHFEIVAAVNKWDEAACLCWLKVRLTGRAQTALQCLPNNADYKSAKKALQERFEPSCRRERNQAQFQARRKKKDEGWTDLVDGLRNLVDKAYSELEDKAKEQLALNHFLSQIENPHAAFSVRQKHPKTVDEAVSATLEMESYPDLKTVCKVDASDAVDTVEDPKPIGVNAMTSVPDMMKQVMDRLEKLEARIDRPTSRALDHTRTPLTCWNCGKQGHIARSCRTTPQRQGNGKPSMD